MQWSSLARAARQKFQDTQVCGALGSFVAPVRSALAQNRRASEMLPLIQIAGVWEVAEKKNTAVDPVSQKPLL